MSERNDRPRMGRKKEERTLSERFSDRTRESYKKLIHNRIVYTFVVILIQIAWFELLILRLSAYSTAISVGLTLLSVAMILYVINKDDNPAYTIGWVVLMALVPLFGGLLYFLFGNKRPSKKMLRRMMDSHSYYRHILKPLPKREENIIKLDDRMEGLSHYVWGQSEFPIYPDTQTTYYPSGEEMFPAMLEAMRKAEHFIFLEYFIIDEGEMWDEMLSVIQEKADAGVEIRIIYDDFGCVSRLAPDYDKWLESLSPNIKCMAFNPLHASFSLVVNHRSHRKILVCDGHTAFTGGINISDEYINRVNRFGYWKDTGVRLYGEGVWNFTVMFFELWGAYHSKEVRPNSYRPHSYHPEPFTGAGFVQPFSDTPLDNEPLAHNIYLDIIAQAVDYVYIFTPYLIIDYEMQSSLIRAAKRGVDVRIVTPEIPDKKLIYRLTRSNYLPLIEGGVKIYQFTPGFIHAKSILCDDRVAVVGSINMDYRSLFLHFECGVLMYDADCLGALKDDVMQTIGKSRLIEAKDCADSIFGRMLDAVLRLFSPLC